MICPTCTGEVRVTDYVGYFVCLDGHFISTRRWRGQTSPRVIAPVIRPDRYDFVRARIDNNRVTLDLHLIVAKAFHGNPPTEKHEARHLDGNKHNNRASNISWGTHQENCADQILHGTNPLGSRNGKSKLTEMVVAEIKIRLAQGESPTDLAPEYGCSREVIYDIRHGRKWKHV